MVTIKVFGSDADGEQYGLLLERARAVAGQFDDEVAVEEHEAWDDVANELGIAGSPALAVDAVIVCVHAVPSMRHVLATVEHHLAKARD